MRSYHAHIMLKSRSYRAQIAAQFECGMTIDQYQREMTNMSVRHTHIGHYATERVTLILRLD